jgi:hypothetical protein
MIVVVEYEVMQAELAIRRVKQEIINLDSDE